MTLDMNSHITCNTILIQSNIKDIDFRLSVRSSSVRDAQAASLYVRKLILLIKENHTRLTKTGAIIKMKRKIPESFTADMTMKNKLDFYSHLYGTKLF